MARLTQDQIDSIVWWLNETDHTRAQIAEAVGVTLGQVEYVAREAHHSKRYSGPMSEHHIGNSESLARTRAEEQSAAHLEALRQAHPHRNYAGVG